MLLLLTFSKRPSALQSLVAMALEYVQLVAMAAGYMVQEMDAETGQLNCPSGIHLLRDLRVRIDDRSQGQEKLTSSAVIGCCIFMADLGRGS